MGDSALLQAAPPSAGGLGGLGWLVAGGWLVACLREGHRFGATVTDGTLGLHPVDRRGWALANQVLPYWLAHHKLLGFAETM